MLGFFNTGNARHKLNSGSHLQHIIQITLYIIDNLNVSTLGFNHECKKLDPDSDEHTDQIAKLTVSSLEFKFRRRIVIKSIRCRCK